MCVIKINLAPARFELGTFCLERILYSTEPQPIYRYTYTYIYIYTYIQLYIYVIYYAINFPI